MFAREIGSYWIMDKIGESRIGTVYKGIHRTLDHEAAVTLVKPEFAVGSGRERVLSTVELLKRLSHRNVVKVVDCVAEGEDLFLLNDLVPGETLAEKVGRDGGLTAEGVRDIFLPVLAAFHYMHGKKVVHGDLHSDDIIVGPDGVVQVGGFGMGAFCRQQRHEAQEETADADLQALGAILAASLSRAPVGNEGSEDSAAQGDETPAHLQKIVAKATATEAEKRYRNAKEFAQDVAAACGGGKWARFPESWIPAWTVLFLLVLLPLPFVLHWQKPQRPLQHRAKMMPAREKTAPAVAPAERHALPPQNEALPHLQLPPTPNAAPPAASPNPAPSDSRTGNAEAPVAPVSAAPRESPSKPSGVANKAAGGAVGSASMKHARKEHRKRKIPAKSHLRYLKRDEGVSTRQMPASAAVPAPVGKEPWQIRK